MNRLMNHALRFSTLILGLFCYGLGLALMVEAKIGLAPWDVLAQGISVQSGITYGGASVVVSILVLVCWIPLKQRFGLGTILNGLLIGPFADLWMYWLPEPSGYLWQLGQFALGLVVVAFATGLYVSAQYGTGPRDGLMIGTQRRTGWDFWKIRTGYEVTVLAIGWALGGQFREGTLIFALSIGPLMQLALRLFRYVDPQKGNK